MAFINLQKPENLTDLISALFTKRNANWDDIQNNMGKVDTTLQKVVLGDGAASTESRSVAIGLNASVTGTLGCVAIGRDASVTEANTVAVGRNASATGTASAAIGSSTAAGGTYALALGREASASVSGSIAMGYQVDASAASAVAIGHLASATGAQATAIGRDASAAGTAAVAMGNLAEVTAPGGTEEYGVQIGRGTNSTTKRIQLGHASWANTVHVVGTLSKGAGTFEIPHPHPAKKDTHDLRHFFVETNNYGGLIYNFRDVEVTGGTGQLTMPEYFGWLANPATIDIFCQPQKHFGRAYAEIEIDQEHADKPSTLTITADTDGKYLVMVVAERNDPMISEMKERQTHLAEGGMVKDKGKTWDGEVTGIVDDELQEDGDTMITKIYYSKEKGVATQKQEAQLHECRVSTKDGSFKLTPAEASKKTSKQICDLAKVKQAEIEKAEQETREG